ncbi:MAG: RNA polymerase factor sigma-54 [Thermodesulfobacteriota bacterium]|nr:RNA polymerase factor sigma-54 [Thermodesulfobacteriota bacterium]
MALELRQQLKLTQQLVMTPQLQQAIKLLQLSQVELIETIDQELEINPVLEESESEAVPSSKDTDRSNSLQEEPDSYETQPPTLASSELEKIPWEDKAIQDINWKDFWDEDNRSSLPAYSFEKKETQNYENLFTRTTDLREHLTWQLQMTHFNDIERQNACLIIGNLDRNGYLKTTIEEIAEETECSPEKVEDVLKKIQLFDPVGVAARDLKECLLVQMDHLGINDSLVCELVSEHLNLIERHNYQAMAKATGQSLEEITRAIKVITALEPCPGRQFSSEEIQYIVPDIYVYKVDDEYVVTLNDEGMPRLRISSFYRDAIKNGIATSSAKNFIQGKLKSALWLIRSIQQRQKTIYRVTKSIVKFQGEFLDKGMAYLKPLILRTVADDIEMHESTISRVTTNKYVHTPQGIFELKFFFSASLGRDDGSDVASFSVKEQIRQMIQAEDLTQPYSDKQIVEILAKDHIRIARRTVAKYRDLMGILPSSRRKRPAINCNLKKT